MLSRREAIVRTALAGLAAFAARSTRVTAKASQPRVPVAFDVPSGACDCHVHIFDPERFPFAAARTYTPEPAGIDELRALNRALHVERVVVVHPSVYGTDNSCTVNAVRQLGANARGIAVIDDRTPAAELAELARSGIKGIRVNLMTAGVTDPAAGRQRFEFAASRAKEHGWHIQFYTRPSVILAMREAFEASPVPLVFDHFGGAQASAGMNQPGLDVLLGLVRSGTAYVKLSGAYLGSSAGPEYADMAPFAKAFIAANPERVIWGTDWPHPDALPKGRRPTDLFPLLQVEDGTLMNQLTTWAPDAGVRKQILVDNPARLYGF